MTRSRHPMAGPERTHRFRQVSRRSTVLVAVAVIAAVAVGGVLVIRGGADNGFPPGLGGSASPADSGDAAGLPSVEPSAVPAPGNEVYAFVPYWEMDGTIAAHVAATRATTVALFSVTHTSTGTLAMSQTGARRITGPIGRAIIAAVHAHHRRVDLTYTSFGGDRNHALFASMQLQDQVIASLVALRATLKVDGIAVDIEQLDPLDIAAYGDFVGRLRKALVADHPGGTVTVATTAGPMGAAMAVAATEAGADRIFLMAYDYRVRTDEPGATTPIVRLDGDGRVLGWSLDLYGAAGVPPQRTLLGLPLYGLSWPTDSPELGAPSTGTGSIWIPRQHLATLNDPKLTPSLDPLESVEFVAVPRGAAWQAIYWDTPATLIPKIELGEGHGLAGIGFWALGYDRGVPGYMDLIARFRDGTLDATAPPSAAPPADSSATPSSEPSAAP
jgi:spore germination protein YaaH